MPTNALANPLVLPILGLLIEKPRHPYAVFVELRERYIYLRVRNATVYTLLDRLTDAGWIALHGPGQPATLAVTKDGKAALTDAVTREIRDGRLTSGPEFSIALAYLSILTPSQARRLLEGRRERTKIEIARLRELLDSTAGPEIRMIEAHYLLSCLEHHAAWLSKTRGRIETRQLTWGRTNSPG